jgi:prepilin-type N-terminal cleavage/methylation domain-containing protein
MRVSRTSIRSYAARRHRENPAGFTLIELLVAMVLIQIGLLALVATNGVLVRQLATVRARTTAINTASNRLQLLGVTRCVAVSGSNGATTGMVEYWSTELRPNGTRELRDSVTFTALGTTHFVALRTRLPC